MLWHLGLQHRVTRCRITRCGKIYFVTRWTNTSRRASLISFLNQCLGINILLIYTPIFELQAPIHQGGIWIYIIDRLIDIFSTHTKANIDPWDLSTKVFLMFVFFLWREIYTSKNQVLIHVYAQPCRCSL